MPIGSHKMQVEHDRKKSRSERGSKEIQRFRVRQAKFERTRSREDVTLEMESITGYCKSGTFQEIINVSPRG